MRISGCALLVITFSCLPATGSDTISPTRVGPPQEAIDKWQDMRFGMFVHWGPVSLKGTEIGWSRGNEVPTDEYDSLYTEFNPTEFDADEWAQIAKDAGMRYMVITAKHHDGFCLWHSKHTEYDTANTPFRRDILEELARACKKNGILLCAYYSVCDWHHPDYPLGSPHGRTEKPTHNMPRYYAYLKHQTRELIENYGPLGVMWFDGEWEDPWTREYGNALYDYLKGIQPDLLINNRVSKGRAGMAGTTKQSGLNAGDFDTPEQRVGVFNCDRPWESCITICRQWAWKPDDPMKSKKECIQTLVRTVGGDGNFLLNVGPMPDGRIEPRQAERLMEMGAWLKKCGESIYRTRGGPIRPSAHFVTTRRANTMYLHVFEEAPETIRLPVLSRNVVGASFLSGESVSYTHDGKDLNVVVPNAERDPIDTIIKIDFDQSIMDLPATNPPSDFSEAKASGVYQELVSQYGPEMAVDGNPSTRWATDNGTSTCWIELTLNKSTTIRGIRVVEATEYAGRVERFEVKVRDGKTWATVAEGEHLGDYVVEFPARMAEAVRLEVSSANQGPTISEVQIIK